MGAFELSSNVISENRNQALDGTISFILFYFIFCQTCDDNPYLQNLYAFGILFLQGQENI